MTFSKTQIYIAIGVLLTIIAVGVYFYRKGRKTTTTQFTPYDLPGNTTNTPQMAGASNAEIKSIANGLYNEMKGVNFFGHDMEFYKRALLLSDTDIVKLYNTFNTLYQAESNETLTKWLQSELFSSTFEREGLLLIDRLTKLNCY